MVGLGRFELPTSPLSGVRSNQLSYRPGQSYKLQRKKEAFQSFSFMPYDFRRFDNAGAQPP